MVAITVFVRRYEGQDNWDLSSQIEDSGHVIMYLHILSSNPNPYTVATGLVPDGVKPCFVQGSVPSRNECPFDRLAS